MRWAFNVAVIALVVVASCDVQVKERFRNDASATVTTTTISEVEIDAGESGSVTSTTSGARSGEGLPIPGGALDRLSRLRLIERPIDMVGTMVWSQDSMSSEFDVSYDSDVHLDLTLLRVSELERLGILESGESLDPRVRWYAVAGVSSHNLRNSECVPTGDSETCEIARVTDGSLVGLASRDNDVVNVALAWRTLGSGGLSVPSISVRIRDSSGRSAVTEHELVRVGLEASGLIGGRSTRVEVGAGAGRGFSARGGQGRLVIVDDD